MRLIGNPILRKVIYTTLLLLCCGLLSSCTVRFMYNQADLLVPWYVKSYIELNKGQSRFVKQRVNYHHKWHRHTQLPAYANLLRKITPLVVQEPGSYIQAPDISLEEINGALRILQQETKQLSRQLANRIAPDLAELFLTASEDQLADMYERFEKDNASYKEKYISINTKARTDLMHTEMRAHFERWIGSMTPKQKESLETWSRKYIPPHNYMLTYRIRWQKRFKDLLGWYHSEQLEVKEDLTKLFAQPDQGWHSDHEAILQHNAILTRTLIADVLQSLTKRQRKRLSKKIEKIASSFEELAQEGR